MSKENTGQFDSLADHSANNRRIAKNTLMLYVRMLFGMLVSLYTSRVLLNALGVEDYGIYGAVGGFVSMFSLISASQSAAVSRFLTFELGTGNREKLRLVFSTSLLIQVVLVIIVLILSETLGIWFLHNKMTIPPARMAAAEVVFQASIVSFVFSLLSVPFSASIVSHEKLGAFAFFGIFEILARLAIVIFIAYSSWVSDRLITYSVLVTILGLTMQAIYLLYCRRSFEECRISFSFDRKTFSEMGSFATWNFIGCTAGLLKDQGVNLLYNVFVGPVLNAARGIATSVNTAVTSFASNFMTALNPQITKLYAAGDLEYAHSLVERGSRFSFYIILFFAVPILMETEFILGIWLGNFPEHSIDFVHLVLMMSLITTLSNTLINLQNATGKIRNYQIVVGGILMLNFPLSYLCLKLGMQPESTYIVAILVDIACLFARLLFLRKMAGLSMPHFIRHVLLNVTIVTASAVVLPFILHLSMPLGWPRFLTVGFVSVVTVLLSVLYLGCSAQERQLILGKARTIINRIRG
ncbi:MAG: lipopolysaccharide biosynthesis protein [Candidatus Cryptobacteroides sp.]